jgi:hypothetical protein
MRGNLPVSLHAKFALVINLKTTSGVGLGLPPTRLALRRRSDRMIAIPRSKKEARTWSMMPVHWLSGALGHDKNGCQILNHVVHHPVRKYGCAFAEDLWEGGSYDFRGSSLAATRVLPS